ncbi:unnamed protein product [Rhizoctonia solani]|uniref:Transmembrane protein n=1 Tax=Rhizoctonia solani TaxID=456999 RepID=A0A8H3E9N2_9AGAM|nr:unnamed protein product [Rhizoctonia solani]
MLSLLTSTTNSNGGLTFMNLTIFPNGGMKILSAMIHLVGSSILAYCIARRIKTVRATSVNELKALSWPRVCVVLILIISWLFVFGGKTVKPVPEGMLTVMPIVAGILIHGVGMATSFNACEAGIYLCIWLYAISKVLIYAFLIEKVRVVWDIVAQPRLTSPVYLMCLFVVVPFCGVPILMVVGRIAFFREDTMACVIGLKPFSSLALLVYDLCMNIFLNAMFLWPLLRSKLINPRLRAVARRTLVAAAAALATSIINIAILTAMEHQLGWVCLGSCGTDVTLNAMVIFWVTLPMTDPAGSHSGRAAQSSSYIKPSSIPQSPAPIHSPILFTSQAAYAPRASLVTITKPSDVMYQPSPRAHDLRHASLLRGLPEFPDPPATLSSSTVDISSTSPAGMMEDGDKRPNSPNSNSSGPIRSLRKLFGSQKQGSQDMEVHVSVVTQQEVELSALENGRARQGDGESTSRTERSSEWLK